MGLLSDFPTLRDIPIFRMADETYLDSCFRTGTTERRWFSEGETVYSSESSHIQVGILLSGKAEIHSSGGEERALLRSITVGDMFGIANLYAADTAFPTVIRAAEATEILFIDGAAFRSFIENNPSVLHFYLRFLSQKIVYLNRKIATFTAGSAEKKLAVFLSENHVQGRYRGSMTTLANLLGIGRASLYRAIDRLSELGFLLHEGNNLILLDPAALCTYCQTS